MDYEKKYKEALELARDYYKANLKLDKTDENLILEDIFPELAESEDERIRKLCEILVRTCFMNELCTKEEKNDCIAWLENQQKPIINVPSREVTLAIWDLGNEWKELTNGSISTEYGTQLNYIQKHWHESEYYLKVKQGENHADKVESKFHEGDWVVIKANGNEHVKQIVRIEYFTSGHPQYILSDGLWFGNGTEARLWTIEDVKPGDVLYSPCCKLLWIYKDDNSCYVGHNLNYSENCVVVNSPICIPSDVCPATKEQRDTLERAITDAGYTFDFDKKELKKVEQKPVWSEEDEKIRIEKLKKNNYDKET